MNVQIQLNTHALFVSREVGEEPLHSLWTLGHMVLCMAYTTQLIQLYYMQ